LQYIVLVKYISNIVPSSWSCSTHQLDGLHYSIVPYELLASSASVSRKLDKMFKNL